MRAKCDARKKWQNTHDLDLAAYNKDLALSMTFDCHFYRRDDGCDLNFFFSEALGIDISLLFGSFYV